jgi:hypothetical protein
MKGMKGKLKPLTTLHASLKPNKTSSRRKRNQLNGNLKRFVGGKRDDAKKNIK